MSHRISPCRSCGADLIWFTHPRTNKPHPVNAETVEIGDTQLQLTNIGGHHVSHWSTCPQAGMWRNPRESK